MIQTHFVAIGANLPGPAGVPALATCEFAAREVKRLPYVAALTRGRWYSSGPIPASAQPRYINGMVRFRADISPARLLADLHAIETRAGRVRGAANAARVLDLDIIDMGSLVRDAPDPILPHPRMHERAFVLLPLRDLAPAWVHPRLGTPIAQLVAALPRQDIRPA